ncbi:hypothetical protein [Nocardia sp. N2S4-5]|uniref:hypothetical protein n=1 Tax=Nocardia sp. N2S4-5 TaxID=3351565 RepID=UPI0037D210CF
MTALILAIWVVAVVRLTRLVTHDSLTQPIRSALAGRFPQSKLTYLVHCVWCSSIWTGAASAPVPIYVLGLSWWLLPILALAASQLTAAAEKAGLFNSD